MSSATHGRGDRTPAPDRLAGLGAAARRVGSALAFGVVPAAVLAATVALAAQADFAFDLEQFWGGAREVLHGASPYPEQVPPAAVGERLPPEAVQEAYGFPYPAQTALALAPLAALPFPVAAGIFTALTLLAGALTLRLLGVRDWRCYGVLALWAPTVSTVRLGALTLLLGLLAAAAWRYRSQALGAGLAVGAAVALKLFLWPLVVWLLATRRFRAAGVAAATVALTTAATWPILGVGWMADYAALLDRLSDAMEGKGYSSVALVLSLGGPESVARPAALAAGLAVLAAVPLVARRADGDRAALVVALAAALVLSPIVWLHYFALLAVPVALARPRLAPLWLAPLALWLWPRYFADPEGAAGQIAFGLAVVAVTVVGSLGTGRVRRAAGSRRRAAATV